MFRGFIAVEIKPGPKVLEFLKELEECGADLKTVEPQNIHITLKFLGDTEEARIQQIKMAMEKACDGIKLFEAKLMGCGAFPDMKFIRVVWIGMKGAEGLVQIAKKLEEFLAGMGFKKEGRRFTPHLTVARVRSKKGIEGLLPLIEKYASADFGAQDISEIKLKKSVLSREGPIYSDVEVIRLGK